MKYLAMCGLSDHNITNYFLTLNKAKNDEDAAKSMIHFVSSEKSQFATLHCVIDLSKYECVADQHYFTICKFQNYYRLIHSFGQEVSLKQYLKSYLWVQRN